MFRPSSARANVKAKRASVGRLAITLFALFAFTFQSFVAQVHFHATPSLASTALHAGMVSHPGKLPANDDQSNCPICQVVLHAGQFITPSAIAFALPSVAMFAVTITSETAPVAQTASHNWQSRAPPRS